MTSSDSRGKAHEGVTENSPIEISPSEAREARLPLPEGALEVLNRLLEVQRELDERKRFYAEYNELVIKLVCLGFVSAEIGGVGTVTLVDNFANGNTAWTSAAVQRFGIEVVTPELAAKRARRAAKEGAK